MLFLVVDNVRATTTQQYVINKETNNTFPLATKGKVVSMIIGDHDYKGVKRVATHLQQDLFKVTNVLPKIYDSNSKNEEYILIIGTLGKSEIINKLVKEGKIDGTQLKGKWEKFITQIIENPIKGVKKALVIAGSDKRGTIYGMYNLSEQIGVSPWQFWADVPAKKQTELHVLPGVHSLGEPKVKYRGIFINDEAPALTGWANETFGGFNSKFYEHVFELILRLKGNYLWPAMWGNKFYVDDPKNGELADEYGIVMGTSHHEPLTRAHAEWNKNINGAWDFNTNAEGLNSFWKKGMERMGDRETLVTIGMRGDGDEPMTEGTAIELLENIVKSQRNIIKEVTGKPVEETPQIWALYKEVQEYYDKGMKVPDDVTLLLCDDNWGNLRTLPSLDAAPRKGGYGIYYHFDYVGGPRSYKWINTNQIERTWEQMHLAYEHGVDQVWIVNVGDIKPMELPISFFLDYAWNPNDWTADNLKDYYVLWAEDNFPKKFKNEIANLLKLYTKYNSRRTPELLDQNTYSLLHYNEAEKVTNDYKKLADKAIKINENLKPEYKDAFYQLVLYPILASANLQELYLYVAKNYLYAKQGRVATNKYAEKVKELFNKDAELTKYYHNQMANGKWNHMMSQTHIGYRIWSDPKENILPKTKTIQVENISDIGVAVEGSDKWWPNNLEKVMLPTFTTTGSDLYYFEIFNRGNKPFDFKIKSKSELINLSKTKGTITDQERIKVSVNWKKVPEGISKGEFILEANGKKIPVYIEINNIDLSKAKGFVENKGIISINASSFLEKSEPENFTWEIIDNLGKTNSAVISLPIKKGRVALSNTSPKLSYPVYFTNKGKVKVHMYFAPTINYRSTEGMYYGLSFDNQDPVKVNYSSEPNTFNYNGKVPQNWHQNVSDHVKIITTELEINKEGNHTLNYYRVDEGLVLQKIVIETKDSQLKESYLGPKESIKIN
ncbi:hypothetical protein GCM10011397_12380 [Wenyingzhuangia marina]|nr:hypothetical protein GCM10011397_12380 [Wenyingzhuangia marina]